MRKTDPVRVGILVDYLEEGDTFIGDMLPVFEMVAEDYLASCLLDRPVEFIVEKADGLPNGSARVVREAFYRLVEQGCIGIFGPQISENGAPLSEYVERLGEVPCITVAGTESMLGEWMFGLPAGSMEEEPIIMANVAWYDGHRKVGLVYEDSMTGVEYLRSARAACARLGIQVIAEAEVPQTEADKKEAMTIMAAARPDAILHLGCGLGVLGINAALNEIGWMPPRYTTTAFEFSSMTDDWRRQLAGWIGLDQYDERNTVAQAFFDRFEQWSGRRLEYYWPALSYDVARMLLLGVATARPLTGKGVKEALERVKMVPTATGAPGTRMRFGKFIRHGWLGSEFLVARRVLDDGSKIVMHGTIEGLVPPK